MKFSIFEKYPRLRYGISEKSDGAMELGKQILNGAEPIGRNNHFKKLGVPYEKVVSADLIHGINVSVVDYNNGGIVIPKTDGLLTKFPNLFLAITVADCFPIYFFDPEIRIIGLVHAGWRGVTKNITSKALEILSKLGATASNLLIGIGPGIQVCHFEVKEDALKEFGRHDEIIERDGKTFVDLSAIIQKQIAAFGVPKEKVENSGECTYCLKDRYFSYRRDKPAEIRAMVAYIGKLE
ncbi:hypothetical protein A2757_00910 [Candidatus Giovannonibacteria bacterium RIFCSPHIGHO2_01_FULL_48_47]|nr:MAG: hypothetical protein A2757_00910 [Candidatus Giovannonibacteria bacterium RIFCSPHIGHO2_01_FULL_48_47]OGF67631.1 MAG: hypothetical protein A3D61_01990 [Candidatus Giovannonibacteria bacterium RIFCSPHIGHO2_02_FULL_48_15]OGF88524.1 MAG: hypothetical protein A3B26_03205 [Candidatus Giovannonibacteria bacterium RIFCSPLOWO2_01_FULL_48_47]OGF95421.1 MAG: hypothetical protein A2433_00690 [Candidatus Giovannonibacteria bacterium RIFOXYC1_FULL_48_8]OGF95968.1 MAG: hypothetical protein A2613_00120